MSPVLLDHYTKRQAHFNKHLKKNLTNLPSLGLIPISPGRPDSSVGRAED